MIVRAARRFVNDGRGVEGIQTLALEVERPRRLWKEGLVAAMAALSSCLTKQVNERVNGSVVIVVENRVRM